jgi:LAS superfamily LD-carboxypeptidase LdcB
MTEKAMMELAVECARKQTPGRLPKHVTSYGFTLEVPDGKNTKDVTYYESWFWKR